MMNQMTQNQALKPIVLLAVTSIAEWAGRTNGIMYLDGDSSMPYVEKERMYYYFGRGDDGYSLLCSCSRDLMKED